MIPLKKTNDTTIVSPYPASKPPIPYGRTHLHESHCPKRRTLTAPAPHGLQEAILLRQSVERIVALAHGAHEAAESIGLVLAGVSAVLVYEANGKLHRGVVLGFDNAVCC
jgi:hypothetical protein